MNARRWWLPSASVCIWLAFFVGAVVSDWRVVMINADGDACMHCRLGQWMIDHRGVLRADHFSHTRPGAPIVSMEWLSEVIMAAAKQACGWEGVVLLAAALIATCLFLLHRRLLAEGDEILLSTGLVMVAALACSMHWLARPHLVTQLFGLFFALQLRAFDRDRLTAGRLFGVAIPLMVVWVNLHGGFFIAFVLIAIYLAGNTVLCFTCPSERLSIQRRINTLVLLGAACLAASLCNPNGWRLHSYIINAFRIYGQVGFTNEFRSPNFHSSGMRGFLLQLLLFVTLLLAARPSIRITDIFLVGGFGFLALQSVRNVPLFALITTPVLAEHFTMMLRDRGESAFLKRFHGISTNLTALNRQSSGYIPAAGVVLLIVWLIAKPLGARSGRILESEIMTNRFPVAAVQFLRARPDAVHGEMFNEYGWGGYLMLALPEHKVFIDGRNDFYGTELMKEFNTVDDVEPSWKPVLEKHNVGWTILPPKHPLNSILALLPDWKRVYSDDVTVIYQRIASGSI